MTKEELNKLEQKLIPCPWCGKKPKLLNSYNWWWVRCRMPKSDCKVAPDTLLVRTPEEAVKIWNSIKIELSANESAKKGE